MNIQAAKDMTIAFLDRLDNDYSERYKQGDPTLVAELGGSEYTNLIMIANGVYPDHPGQTVECLKRWKNFIDVEYLDTLIEIFTKSEGQLNEDNFAEIISTLYGEEFDQNFIDLITRLIDILLNVPDDKLELPEDLDIEKVMRDLSLDKYEGFNDLVTRCNDTGGCDLRGDDVRIVQESELDIQTLHSSGSP